MALAGWDTDMRMRVGMEERGRAADAHPALACAHLGYEETG